ncbi:unnamed protein product [Mortierella alpina]
MGVKYDRADKTRNYTETSDIKMKRRRYLQERYSAKYKDALFVWLDESYIHHHHVHNKSWFSDGMTVLRKNKGRRWCIIYAGGEYGWMGNPWIWEADSRSADYHENMNATMFEKYMKALCRWCKTKYPEKKVVFCMDNAKYHRRKYQDPSQQVDTETEHIATIDDYLRVTRSRRKGKLENNAPQKSLSQLNKDGLVRRLAPFLIPKLQSLMAQPLAQPLTVGAVAEQLKLQKKGVLYALARKPEHALPLSTELLTDGFKKVSDLWPKLVRRTCQNEMKYIKKDRIDVLEDHDGSWEVDVDESLISENEDDEEEEEQEEDDVSQGEEDEDEEDEGDIF